MPVFDELSALFSLGSYEQAERMALGLLELNPSDTQARYMLAQSLAHQGRHEEALARMRELIEADPMQGAFQNDYGTMLAAMERWGEAEAAYRMALVLDRQSKDARLNLAHVLFRQERREEALVVVEALLDIFPDAQEAYILKGEILRGLSRNEVFLSLFKAGRITRDTAANCFLFANLMRDAGEREKALEYYRRSIELNPGFVDAYNNMGLMLLEAGKIESARQSFLRALNLAPDFFPAFNNLANSFLKQNDLEQARHYYQQALIHAVDPKEVLPTLADVCHRLHYLDEARIYYRQMLTLAPDSPRTQFVLGTLLLLQGEFEAGWPLYEARWRIPDLAKKRPQFGYPQWQGEPLAGKRLLVCAEQGFGDNIQFARYFSLLRKQYPSATLYYWCQDALTRLFEPYASGNRVALLSENVSEGLPAFDYQVMLMSLSAILGTTLASIPEQNPVLAASSASAGHWYDKIRARTTHRHGKRVGIVWSGRGAFLYDKLRSLSLEQLAPLFKLPGIIWFPLQKNPAGEPDSTMVDLMDAVEDFADTAAIIAHLDLVISVDTSVAHLAGAMGKPVWLLNRFDTDWRWLLDRTDSPWYPSMHIFRQPALGDWTSVVTEVTQSLSDLLSKKE